jgi:hypothetical protein
MRRKINEAKAIFDEIYNVYKNVKPKCKGLPKKRKINHTTKERRNDIRKLEKIADNLLQKQQVPNNPNCIVCGGITNCMHHVVYKSQSNALRYNPLNLVPLCSKCHTRLHFSGDPAILGTIIKIKGIEWFDTLQSLRHETIKQTKERLEAVIVELETLIYGKPKQLPWE